MQIKTRPLWKLSDVLGIKKFCYKNVKKFSAIFYFLITRIKVVFLSQKTKIDTLFP